MEFINQYTDIHHSVNFAINVKAPATENEKVKEYFEAVNKLTREFFFALGDTNMPLYLLSPGLNKINVIKVIRDVLGCGLKEAKDMVESPLPYELSSGMPREKVLEAKRSLESAGASVQIGRRALNVMG